MGLPAAISTTIANTGTSSVTISGVTVTGPQADEFLVLTLCLAGGSFPGPAILSPGSSCTMLIFFMAGGLGTRSATVTLDDNEQSPLTFQLSGSGTEGYEAVNAGGTVSARGNAELFGDMTGRLLNAPIVGIAPTTDGLGYWLAGADGGVFSFGDASYLGSMSGQPLNGPIVAIQQNPLFSSSNTGYYLVGSDGGVFAFGAPYFGSTGSMTLNRPVVGMAPTGDGGGYWLVAADGGVFAYGDAGFFGSTGAMKLNQPIVGLVPTPDDGGYWLEAADGGVFSFGDASFFGSATGLRINRPVVAGAGTPTGSGYWLAGADGGVYSFGDAPFYGTVGFGGSPAVTALASSGSSTSQFQFEEQAQAASSSLFLSVPLSHPPLNASGLPGWIQDLLHRFGSTLIAP